ncbi:DinB/UmuC family translesion DNA polymerase [Sphingobium sp. HWE2-09]|uniref:DinB/UmuC family translesion DNA polymerase n=1 Tax=Sphingobium sp. HWE2-09 TaxID=3108390 RepID=UPI002DCA21A5|nr:DUF4113 domain-containing protein [Sphingobium sp. HWE2-09]
MAKLEKLGVHTLSDFVALDPELVRGMLTVTGQRTHAELRGISCMPFSEAPASRKSIACTRSFGRAITDFDEMREAVATYAARAAEKLRRFNLRAGAMQVFMRTNEFNDDPKYSNSVTLGVEATANSFALIGTATRAANAMWRDGFRYFKAGVILLDLYMPNELPAADLFASRDPDKSKALMVALDAINGRYGRESVRPGGLAKRSGGWAMKRENLSPCYTTRVADLLTVKASSCSDKKRPIES